MGRRIAVTVAAFVGAVAIATGAVALSTGILDTEPQRRDAVGDITAIDLAALAPRTPTTAEVQGVVQLPGPTSDAPAVTVEPASGDHDALEPTTAVRPGDASPPTSAAATTPTTYDDHGGSRSGSGGHGSDDD